MMINKIKRTEKERKLSQAKVYKDEDHHHLYQQQPTYMREVLKNPWV